MNTWAPLWSKIVDSSVWCEPYFVRVLFTTMLALKDRDSVVRFTPFALSKRANMTEQEVIEALSVLSSPDTRRIEPQPFEGRRIEKVDDGYLILNGEKYREMVQKEWRKVYQANWQSKKRAKEKQSDEPQNNHESTVTTIPPEPPAESVAEGAPIFGRKFIKPSLEDVTLQASKIGLAPVEVQKFLNHYEANGWKVGRNPMKSWTHALSNWKLNAQTYGNQPNSGKNNAKPVTPVRGSTPVGGF